MTNITGTLQGTATLTTITWLAIMSILVTLDQVMGRFQEISLSVPPLATAQDRTNIRVIDPAQSPVMIPIIDTALIAAIITLADPLQITMATQCHILVVVLPMYIVTFLTLHLHPLRLAIHPCPFIITFLT